MNEQKGKELNEMWNDPYDMPPTFYVKRELLEVKSFTQRVCTANFELRHENSKDFFSHTCYTFLLRVASAHVGNYEFVSPLDWFEHLKERFAPKWVLRKWPVKMRTEKINVEALFHRMPLLKGNEPYILVYNKTKI